MKRREFLTQLGSAAVAVLSPAEIWAQQAVARAQPAGRVYRIGILETIPAAQNAANLDALRDGLRRLGYIEGQNLVIEYRSADGRAERFAELTSELVRLKVDLIVTRGTPAVQAAKEGAPTTPVVMAAMGAPFLVVASLARPGGNVTGLTTFSAELIGKRIELLKELVPGISRLAVLHNIGNPMSPPEWDETKAAARSLGLQALLLDVRNEEDLRRSFEELVQQHADALLVGLDALTQLHQRAIVEFASRNRLPASYPSRDFVEIGGLMAYAVNYPSLYFRAASFVDQIFKGARPSELPIEQPAKFELVINLRTAKSLGLTIPPIVLFRADVVIE